MGLQFQPLTPEELRDTLSERYRDVDRLLQLHPKVERPETRPTLNEVARWIATQTAPPLWETQVARRFLLVFASLARQEIMAVEGRGEIDAATVAEQEQRADWLCSFATVHGGIDADAKAVACTTWVMSRLMAGMPAASPEDLITSVLSVMSPLGLTEEAVTVQVKIQLVLWVARRLKTPPPEGLPADTAKRWCEELVQRPNLQRFLLTAAKSLGVGMPRGGPKSRSESVGIAANASPTSSQSGPPLWTPPEVLADERIAEERASCLKTMQAFQDDGLWGQRTAQDLQGLSANATPNRWALVLFYAARDLWNAYVTKGDCRALRTAQQAALLSYQFYRQAGDDRARPNRLTCLELWMACQLATLIRTCDLQKILDDAGRLCGDEHCPSRRLPLIRAAVEAHAGACREMEGEPDQEGRRALLSDNGSILRRLHEEYMEEAKKREWDTEAEQADWKYLFPASGASKGEGADETDESLLQDDKALKDVLNRGSHDELHGFIEEHLPEIRRSLQRRLDVRLSPEHVMVPEGEVRNPQKASQDRRDPLFVQAEEKLSRGEFEQAAQLFDRLAKRVSGVANMVCVNYQAYALARCEQLFSARLHLDQLVRAGFTYAAAYWNLACCMAAEQADKRLDVLISGLEHAPHPKLLQGTIYLSLILDDNKRLRDWLPCLNLFEALLLLYYLEFDDLDGDGRDQAMNRIGMYVLFGEPRVPDPDSENVGERSLLSLIDELLKRHQDRAVDFWLRCRQPHDSRFQFWAAKAHFLERINRLPEAMEAFREEIRRLLAYLRKPRTIYPGFLTAPRERVEQRLQQCMTPELRSVGREIYQMLEQFETQTQQTNVWLLPRHNRRIREYYKDLDRTIVDTAGGGAGERRGERSAGIDALLARVGAECRTRLHEATHLADVRTHIDRLLDELRQWSQPAFTALQQLLSLWESCGRQGSKEERQELLRRCQETLTQFRKALLRDLNPDQRQIAGQLLDAFDRVNGRLARSLQLLPTLRLSPVQGDACRVDPAAGKTSFAVRLECLTGSEPAVQEGKDLLRLKGATARLDDGLTEFSLRDELSETPVWVGVEQSAVLTFEIGSRASISGPRSVQVELTYEYAGGEFVSEPYSVQLEPSPCPPLPPSPYIYSRSLYPHEIEHHFFGRDREQDTIFESVRSGKLRYVEGIRRSGKSSLLRSLEYESVRRGLPLIPVYWSAVCAQNYEQAGLIVHNLLDEVARHPQIVAAGVQRPEEQRCRENLPDALRHFSEQLALVLSDRRVLVLIDDFQVLPELGQSARESRPELFNGIMGFLNLLYEQINRPQSALLWVLAGQLAFRRFKNLLPGALLWGVVRPLPVDFLDAKAVGDILAVPLKGSGVVVPPETIARVYHNTAGYPEVVQQMGELMLSRAAAEKRDLLTPHDADCAAREIAALPEIFSETWCPWAQLSMDQRMMMAKLINAVEVGGCIDSRRLAHGKQLSDVEKDGLEDLMGRKILDRAPDGTFCVKANVLDRWLHNFKPIEDRGCVAIFVDVANLTRGTGSNVIGDFATAEGEGKPGRFSLATIIDCIHAYAGEVNPEPIAARCAVNYPERSPAIYECNAKGYYVENIPDDLIQKGSDDTTLIGMIWEVWRAYPTVSHFLLVSGDKDYRPTINKLLANHKTVHMLARGDSISQQYDYLARQYPNRFILKPLEDILKAKNVGHV